MATEYVIDAPEGGLRIVLVTRFGRRTRWQVQVDDVPVATGIGVSTLADNGFEIAQRLDGDNKTVAAGELRRLILGMEAP